MRSAFLLASAVLAASAAAQTFHKAIGTSQIEIANDIIATSSCGFAVTGYRALNPQSTEYVLVSQLDDSGVKIWANQFGPLEGRARGYTLAECSDGGYIVGAETAFGGTTLGKYILRLTSAGALQWSLLQPGTPFLGVLPLGVSVRELHDRSTISVNRIANTQSAPMSGVFSRIRDDGAPLLSRVFSLAGVSAQSYIDFADVGQTLRTPWGDNIFIVGNFREFQPTGGFGNFQVLAVRLDPSGSVSWAHTYAHPTQNITADGLCFASDGDLIVSGRLGTGIASAGPSDLAVMRIDLNSGAVQWAVSAVGQSTHFTNAAQGIQHDDAATEVVIAGRAESTSSGVTWHNAAAVRFDAKSGAFKAGMLYGRFQTVLSDSAAGGVCVAAPYGGLALAGFTNDIGWGQTDIKLIRTFDNLESGCRQAPFSPIVTSFTPAVKKRTLSSFDASFQVPQTSTVSAPLLDIAACFLARCVGDLNNDGLVDDRDFVFFVLAYNKLECPTNPLLTCCPADLNNDGVVDDADFVAFIPGYNALECP